MAETAIKKIKNNWLLYLVVLQPALDILAYWAQNSVATVAGYLRLGILLFLPCILLLRCSKEQEKKRLFLCLTVIIVFCLLHIANGFRTGYANLFSDVQYLLRVVQMPVLAVCFIHLMRCEEERGACEQQILNGILGATALYLMALVISLVTGSWNSTYGGTIGISGWVIDSNRCANSILLVTYSTFLMYHAASSRRLAVNLLAPVLVVLLLLSNGTKACYFSALGLMAGYAAFELFGWAVLKQKVKPGTLFMAVVLFVTSIVAYPITPRARQDAIESSTGQKNADAFKLELLELGYDIDSMTLEDKLADEYLVGRFQTFYYQMMFAGVPQLLDGYDIRRVLAAYDMTTDPATLIDVRRQKRTYASFVFEDSDTLTRCVGFEFDFIGRYGGAIDLENDWPALFYYYGYIGFAMYVAFILYFLFLVIRRLVMAFRQSYTPLNFTLLVCLGLQLGLAQLSGAICRRPNVSVFLSLVLALIYYETKLVPVQKKGRSV